MKQTIRFTGTLSGKIKLPASKSISNRALILSSLSDKTYDIQNLSDCDDTRVMIYAFSSGEKEINIGAAGTAMRFLTAYLSVLEGEWNITGTERMKNRPIRILVEALRSLGAVINYTEKEGFPPLRIKGGDLKGGDVALDGCVSSQYISALMMIAPLMENGLTLHLKGKIISMPYIRMTVRMMETFGARIDWNGNSLRIRRQNYKPVSFTVENDWTAASYWYEAVALAPGNPEIELIGLYRNSMQGDAKVADLFGQLGVVTKFTEYGVKLSKQPFCIDAFEYDFVNEPDLAQTFVVTCALKNIPFRFSGLQSLRIKETDRITALQKEMRKLGYIIHDQDDSRMEWIGERVASDPNPFIDTYEDHRMAMAFAPAAIKFDKIHIVEPLVVTKSYPRFWEDLESIGFINQYSH